MMEARTRSPTAPTDALTETVGCWCWPSDLAAAEAAARAAAEAHAIANPPPPPRVEPPAPPLPFTDGRLPVVGDAVDLLEFAPTAIVSGKFDECARVPAKIVAVQSPSDPRSNVDLQTTRIASFFAVAHRLVVGHEARAWDYREAGGPGWAVEGRLPRPGERVVFADREGARPAVVAGLASGGVVPVAGYGSPQVAGANLPRLDLDVDEPLVRKHVGFGIIGGCWAWPIANGNRTEKSNS